MWPRSFGPRKKPRTNAKRRPRGDQAGDNLATTFRAVFDPAHAGTIRVDCHEASAVGEGYVPVTTDGQTRRRRGTALGADHDDERCQHAPEQRPLPSHSHSFRIREEPHTRTCSLQR
jgi:hypothetical protein